MPSITFWTRLEPFTRLDNIDQGLQARLHDPLWLLARQWQNGEFQGEDSGTPVQARLRMEGLPLTRYLPGPAPQKPSTDGQLYQAGIPLEALVEREPVQLAGDPRRDLRLAAEAGLYFLRLLERLGAGPTVRADFVKAPEYRLAAAPDDPAGELDQAGRSYLAVMAGRSLDGFLLFQALLPRLRPPLPGTPSLPESPLVAADDIPKVIQAGQAYLAWFESRFPAPPAANPSWNPERMEYAFCVSAPDAGKELVLESPEYLGGRLDWYDFNLNSGISLGVQPTDPQPQALTRTLMPAPLRYQGMAADRWWEFEDGQVNLNRIQGDPDELMRLLLVHFALVYSNDWYLLPVELPPGAAYRTQSMVVTDAFGERTLVRHYSDLDPAPRDWRMFAFTRSARSSLSNSAGLSDNLLFLPPVLATSLQSDPIEEVLFLRDEISNLVWAVEKQAPGLAGDALKRYELYQRQEGGSQVAGEEENPEAGLRYLLATATPDYWIPFLPQRIDPALPDIRLRRAAALIDRPGQPPGTLPEFTRPLGRLLEPERQDLSLFEEEVPRSGLRLLRRYQYARWVDGSSVLWLSRTKGAGSGEGTAGLYYDQVE